MVTENENRNKQGSITFWNKYKGFGFVEIDNEQSIFFSINNISKTYRQNGIKLFDFVSFNIRESKNVKHKGKLVGYNLKLKKRGAYDNYQRAVGTLKSWRGIRGYIASPQLEDKQILLFKNRITELEEDNIKPNQLFFFNPIESTSNENQLFAFFAYPLEKERNVDFLIKSYRDSRVEEVKNHLLAVIEDQGEINIEYKFVLELVSEKKISYRILVNLINKYKKEYNYQPSKAVIKEFIDKTNRIHLWETEVISFYFLDDIKPYFCDIKSDKKRKLIIPVPPLKWSVLK